jgi:hypothetical protein|tara:strand:+ start:431 stop:649 length:219 start_codon:yes stop_codon:yes gene_type:complete
MRHIKFIGAVGVNIFPCKMCGKNAKFKYMKYPHPAVAELLTDREPLEICRKCAKREIGSKNKKAWDKIHEEK